MIAKGTAFGGHDYKFLNIPNLARSSQITLKFSYYSFSLVVKPSQLDLVLPASWPACNTSRSSSFPTFVTFLLIILHLQLLQLIQPENSFVPARCSQRMLLDLLKLPAGAQLDTCQVSVTITSAFQHLISHLTADDPVAA